MSPSPRRPWRWPRGGWLGDRSQPSWRAFDGRDEGQCGAGPPVGRSSARAQASASERRRPSRRSRRRAWAAWTAGLGAPRSLGEAGGGGHLGEPAGVDRDGGVAQGARVAQHGVAEVLGQTPPDGAFGEPDRIPAGGRSGRQAGAAPERILARRDARGRPALGEAVCRRRQGGGARRRAERSRCRRMGHDLGPGGASVVTARRRHASRTEERAEHTGFPLCPRSP